MKRNYNIWALLFLVFLLGCNTTKQANIPDGMVPKRRNLSQEAYGGYIRLSTTTNESIYGEFIGLHQDSVVIWQNKIKLLHPNQIDQAQLYVFDYNSYWGGLAIPMIPNLLLLLHIGEFGGGPLVMAVIFSGLNLIGAGTAESTEQKKVNYFDWNRERTEFLRYARFPQGIPPDIPIYSIEGKNIIQP